MKQLKFWQQVYRMEARNPIPLYPQTYHPKTPTIPYTPNS